MFFISDASDPDDSASRRIQGRFVQDYERTGLARSVRLGERSTGETLERVRRHCSVLLRSTIEANARPWMVSTPAINGGHPFAAAMA